MSKSDKRQRQRENRAERRAREEREERRRRTIRFAIRAAIVVAIVVGAGFVISFLTGDDGPADTTLAATTTTVASTTTTAAATTTTGAATTTTAAPETTTTGPAGLSPEYLAYRELPVACGGTAPPPLDPLQFDTPEDQELAPDVTVTATVSTSCGDLVIEMDPALAPKTVNSFVFLARQDFFDGIVSHRIVPGFVVQIGDPTATSGGGPGYNIDDEFPADGFAYGRGVVAMAKVSGVPGSTGSQFFIGFGDTGLGPEFNPVGRLVGGLDVLDRIEQIPVDGQRPLEALYVEDVAIEVG